jgi:vacuolar-type H+-ATPase subunit H
VTFEDVIHKKKKEGEKKAFTINKRGQKEAKERGGRVSVQKSA